MRKLRGALAGIIAAVAFAFPVGPAQAAPTETVGNLNDSGAGSLRQALIDVDAGGTVAFDSSLSGTISIQNALLIDKSVTIEGPGADRVTLDGGLRDNILVIGSVNPGEHDVTISGLTFYRGLASAPAPANPATTANQGGGISVLSGDSITVTDSVFRQNLAISNNAGLNSEGGGAISVEGCSGAELTIDGSTFRRNSSTKGGGAVMMRSDRSLTIEDSEFAVNSADSEPGGGAVAVRPHWIDETDNCSAYGGNIAPSTSPVSITRSTFLTNGSNADSNGGAIAFREGVGAAEITDSIFRANANDQLGGAIYSASASPMRVAGSTFAYNMTDDYGGAIAYRPGYSGPEVADELLLSIETSLFEGNAVEYDGPAIDYRPAYNGSRSEVTLELSIAGSEFVGNHAGGEGVVLHRAGSSDGVATPVLKVQGSTFRENFSHGQQGGILHYQPTNAPDSKGMVTVEESLFSNNSGAEGGSPIYMNSNVTGTELVNVSVVNNTSGDDLPPGLALENDSIGSPGELDFVPSTYRLSNVTVAGNSSAQTESGSIRLADRGVLDMESSTIAQNSLSGDSGETGSAGLWLGENTTATVRNSVFGSNTFAGPFDGSAGIARDCYRAETADLTLEDANLIDDLTGCEGYTGNAPITGDPLFGSSDPVEVQRLGTTSKTSVVPLSESSSARGAAVGTMPAIDQRGAERPAEGADLGAVQFYETYTVTVDSPPTRGTVYSDSGIECGDRCSVSIPEGETITFRVEPKQSWYFAGWQEACSGDATSCSVSVEGPTLVRALFLPNPPPPEYPLSVFKSGGGQGTVSSDVGGIDCGVICESTFPQTSPRTVVTLTATAADGSTFSGWSGPCSGTAACQVTMDRARSVVANFAQIPVPPQPAEIEVRKVSEDALRVGGNREVVFARVSCIEGSCAIEAIRNVTVRVKGRNYGATAIFQKGSFAAGQNRTVKVRLPQAAFKGLTKKQSGTVSATVVSDATAPGSGRTRVVAPMRAGLKR